MCGIGGLVRIGDSRVLDDMTQIQLHRGPDDRGCWSDTARDGGFIGLSSCRLAILDLSPAGHMPMRNETGDLAIAYNGEVYNFPELRRELEGKGYQFRSHTDTETVLKMYEEYGPDCVRRLNGIFAFAIWDARRQQLFLARDHFGIKPLYYFRSGESLAFASEIKALLQVPSAPRRMNVEALHQYLTFLWVPDPLTMFDGICKVPAGHYAIWRNGEFELTQYWDLEFPPADHRFERSEADLATELRERFIATVRSQVISDVPLGAFLSAGLDSSSIVAAMAQFATEPIRTYTIGFAGKYRVGETTIDDPEVAARTAAHFGCIHEQITVDPDVVDLLPKLVWHMDEPVADPAIITAYLICREARKTVTVLLSGVGGDELFAGYRKYQAHYLAKNYQRIPSALRGALLEPAIRALPSFRGTALKGPVRLLKKMARSGSLPERARFLTDSTYMSETMKRSLYAEPFRQRTAALNPWIMHEQYFDRTAHSDFLNQMLYLDSKAFMCSLNLTYNDKMSMAASVEARVPFLDWQLAEWVAKNVPPELKLHDGTTKYILREAMAPLLPAEVLRQKKAGFGAPIDYWLASDLQAMTRDLLGEEQIRRRGLFEPAVISRMLDEQASGRQDWSMQIWQLLTLEIWQQTFLDSH
jgi:asparagine synthase (glutamine-hydrolysing)